ncbi:MAG: ABC transporter C-terminal domain-containing protein, partial [Aquabacterium sp.]
ATKQGTAADSRTPVSVAADTAPAAPAVAPVVAQPKRKLSYKEQRELDELPARIEALETEQAELNKQLADPEVYSKEGGNVAAMHARVEAIDEELMGLLERWETLGGR